MVSFTPCLNASLQTRKLFFKRFNAGRNIICQGRYFVIQFRFTTQNDTGNIANLADVADYVIAALRNGNSSG